MHAATGLLVLVGLIAAMMFVAALLQPGSVKKMFLITAGLVSDGFATVLAMRAHDHVLVDFLMVGGLLCFVYLLLNLSIRRRSPRAKGQPRKLTVVLCNCGCPELHVKFRDEEGRTSDGIFSLAFGRYFLGRLKKDSGMTEEEYAALDASLVASGLPEFTSFTDEEIDKEVLKLIKEHEPWDIDEVIDRYVNEGQLSPADAERFRAAIVEMSHNPGKAIRLLITEELRERLDQASKA